MYQSWQRIQELFDKLNFLWTESLRDLLVQWDTDFTGIDYHILAVFQMEQMEEVRFQK